MPWFGFLVCWHDDDDEMIENVRFVASLLQLLLSCNGGRGYSDSVDPEVVILICSYTGVGSTTNVSMVIAYIQRILQ